MNSINYILTIALILFLNGCNTEEHKANNNDSKAIDDPYLGQKAPGLTPKVFAQGMVSTEHRDHSAFFTPDMKELYFTRKDINNKKWSLIVYQSDNNHWQESLVGPRVGRPILDPSNKIMYLGNQYMERNDTGWSEIKSLGDPYEDIQIMRLMASSKGTYVFDEATSDGNGVLHYARLINGIREEPKPFGDVINTGKWNAHPFIGPDESYLIWDGERDIGFGSSDLYISYKQPDDTWGEAINLGNKINTSAEENGGYVSPDGKYLFFNRNGNIYWVNTQIIENFNSRSSSLDK